MIASDSQQKKDDWLAAIRAFAPAALPPAPPPAPMSNNERVSSSEIPTRLGPSPSAAPPPAPPSAGAAPPPPLPDRVSPAASEGSPASSHQTAGKRDMRAEVMNELVDTEKAYVRDLNNVIMVIPLLEVLWR